MFSKISLVYMSQPRTHPCTQKARIRLRPDWIFWNLSLYRINKSARSARGKARVLTSISNLNFRDEVDAFWLLGHYTSFKSKKTTILYHENSNLISTWVHALFRGLCAHFYQSHTKTNFKKFNRASGGGMVSVHSGAHARGCDMYDNGIFEENRCLLTTWSSSYLQNSLL